MPKSWSALAHRSFLIRISSTWELQGSNLVLAIALVEWRWKLALGCSGSICRRGFGQALDANLGKIVNNMVTVHRN